MTHKMDKIPIPPSQRWREIRIRVIPLVIFVIVAGVVAMLWKDRVDATTMVGQVVGQQAEVRSPRSGSLAELHVNAFDSVSAGDQLGRVITTDPKIVETELAVILAEIELIRLSMDPFADQQRNLLNYESMQMDLMENRARLGIARIREQQAEREYNRVQRLYDDGLTSEEALDRAETAYWALQEEVSTIENLVQRLDSRLDDMDMDELLEQWKENDPKAAAIEVQRRNIDRITAEMMPVALHAPVSGQVAAVHKMNGEYVDQGDPVLMIHAPRPDHIRAHLKHPVSINPEPGMEVLVRRQNRHREEAIMEIAEVGVQLESVEERATLFPDWPIESLGLPIRIAITNELDLIPGEVVDMSIIRP